MPFNVVYLDDEEFLCENFYDYFNSPEITVHTFMDAEKAFEYITNQSADLIFIDYRLPTINGDEFAQRLPSQIPKILITGEINATTKYRFDQIINKPYRKERIIEVLNTFFKLAP